MRQSRLMPEVNAGSMADIAFLLLIFFLVTAAIPKDKGINRKLPAECPPGVICDSKIKEHNLLRIVLNSNNDIMVENDIIAIEDLKDITKQFLDNNKDGSCDYCSGQKFEDASDNPTKAVISLQNDRNTSYNQFIAVQDELTKALFELRKDYAKKRFNKFPEDLSAEELKQVKAAYPFILSEAETK
ncbi:ExbD/TolR family protein [Thalassobellus suaedae]|uniref:Biopolymer transporter ExbD n=1 Tax=Thalassobellus suaedae TaxID=3074124 RepID=A0ABY9Y289_9FLAO|nr:biopolymer transporter ExbD [Flavobacteriaceae bacterium HL-DH10]